MTPEKLIAGDGLRPAGPLSPSFSRLDGRNHAVMVVVKVGERRIDLGRSQVRMLPQNLLCRPAVKILLRGDVLDGVPGALDQGLAVGREPDMRVCVSSRHLKTPSDSGAGWILPCRGSRVLVDHPVSCRPTRVAGAAYAAPAVHAGAAIDGFMRHRLGFRSLDDPLCHPAVSEDDAAPNVVPAEAFAMQGW